MSFSQLLIGVFLLDSLSTVLCMKCFECVDLPNPFQCDIVTTCPDTFECYVDQKITSGGLILYDVGCRSSERCSPSKRQTNPYDDQEQESSSDIVTCEECCNGGDFCNKAGCGVQDPSKRGPYCFSCHIQGETDQCRHVTQCGVGEVCSIKDTSANNISQYRTECLLPKDCHKPATRRDALSPSVDICSKCCHGDFCNDNCIQTGHVVHGAFATWTAWSQCSVTCAEGHQQRSRSCTNPPPSNGGNYCEGQRAEIRICSRAPCTGPVISTDCPDGWVAFQDSCYLFNHNNQTTFTEAEEYCRERQESHLIQLETRAENEFIKNYLKFFLVESQWIGLTDEQTEGVWKWYTSDTPTTYNDWAPGELNNNYKDREDCAWLDKTLHYQWGDINCDRHAEPICEISNDGAMLVG